MRVPFYFIALLTWLTQIQKKEPRWTPKPLLTLNLILWKTAAKVVQIEWNAKLFKINLYFRDAAYLRSKLRVVQIEQSTELNRIYLVVLKILSTFAPDFNE